MDLKILGPSPTAAERAAIDAVIGATPHGRRDLLLPALHAAQERVGWVSQGALNHISRRLGVPPADAWGVATFYHLIATAPQAPTMLHVCDDIACRVRGAEALCAQLAATAVAWKPSPCLGQCERAPAALLLVAGERPRAVTIAPVRSAAELAAAAADPPAETDARDLAASLPQLGSPGLRLLARAGAPAGLDAYRARGGYQGLTRALAIGREATVAEVTASRLLGRGGAAFPTGRKWEAVLRAAAQPHYVVCNADESEPGTFKDRLLMEEDPFAVVEGMTIAGYASASERGYLYLRGEYPLAAERMAGAIAAARAAGLLGAGSGFDIEVRRGGGAYICGEETALFNSIEGRRGEPRSKPPFPVEVGLFGKPTLVNNVETLVNVPLLLCEGGAAFAATGTSGSSGPKLYCVSGCIARPGLYEAPFGITLAELIAQAGGVPGGRAVQAVLLGGAAGAFVGPGQLDTPLTFEGTRAAGASLGSGVVMVFDDGVDLPAIVRRIAAFFRDESCGQCVPCRVGTVRQQELLDRLAAGRLLGSRDDELALLADLAQCMRDASICGLGQTASIAVESWLRLPTLASRP